MADTRLLLGDFEFKDYELPDHIPFGGAQKLVTHTLPGGARVIQAMGYDHAPIGWNGLFFGPDAVSRAKQVDAMRIAGIPVKLTWGDFSYMVYVESFTAAWERFYKLPYQVSCVILSEALAASSDPGFDQTIAADNTLAQSLGAKVGDSTLTGLLSTMDSAIKGVSTFAGQATATINSVIAPVAAVAQRVQILTASVTNTIQNVATLGGILPNTGIARAAGRLNAQVSAATQLPILQQLQSVTGRITTNLNVLNNGGANVRQVAVAGGNLYDRAAAFYGDATKWDVLAKANDTTDPSVSGVTVLNVPENAPATTDGLHDRVTATTSDGTTVSGGMFVPGSFKS